MVTDGSTVTVAVTSQDSTNVWTKSGIMIRNDITGTGTSAGYLILAVTPGHGVALVDLDLALGDADVALDLTTDSYTLADVALNVERLDMPATPWRVWEALRSRELPTAAE